MLEYAATKIRAKKVNLLSKDFSSHGAEVKSLVLVKDYSRHIFKIQITKGLSRIVAQDDLAALVQLLLPGFHFQTLSRSSLQTGN